PQLEIVYKVANLLGQKGWAKDEIIPILKQALKESDPEKRRNAVNTFGMMRCQEAFTEVLAALQDPNRDVQYYAIWTLGEIGNDGASPALTELSKNSPIPKIRQYAEEALAKIKH
ncbi:MAG: HEAT repeat domain-containing protein, partial [Planctomycetota bacterium]